MTMSPWLILKTKGMIRGDNLIKRKRSDLGISGFISNYLSLPELYR